MNDASKVRRRLLAAVVACSASACAPLSGTTSLTVLSADAPKTLTPSTEVVEERACTNWLLTLFLWGDPSPHEVLVARMLERTGADTLVDAKATSSSWGVPYVFMRGCQTVTARPARHPAGRAL